MANIALEHITKRYADGFEAVKDLNLEIADGEFMILDAMRHRLHAGDGGSRRGVIAGLRPEHFEDASIVGDRSRGTTFKTKIDVLESMGAEFYAYFVLGV